ncbi:MULTISPECIES: TIGR01777 family oxidoreductase [Planococcus]|uniref:TIGR01777 family protein n=1 Tax=Planococcus faecalis TaxID=1598147 RepID=A0ABN4XND0_9BACL|nr:MULTISPECIES: TIGR01777 family oxidoreductase [Planococcus]AQU78669.1 TIGR01777 family protein [Planococcus faecalis]MDJ0332144.1 TIGR01777 family oxidoreductase [Planococcus sp. S3-L1]OHX54492.1 TIGR01777 family protein [Planococcus faecalis]
MKVAITGGTGFVGKELTRLLLDRGDEVVILTRNPKTTANKITYVKWLEKDAVPEKQLEGVDAFVNLAGTSINDGRWSEEQKKMIYSSRMDATNELLRIIHKLEKKPKVLVNASAVGIYPPSQTVTYTEASAELGSDFLAQTVRDWEILAHRAEEDGLRVSCGRFGIVLGKNGGALPLMALPYKMFAGGTVGSGKQWLSWVHIKDVARALAFALDTDQLSGAFNVTAPSPKQMKDFGKEIAHTLGRPHWIPVPSFAMKAILGEKSQLVLEGQRVLPTVLQQHGFQFKFSNLRSALADIYK